MFCLLFLCASVCDPGHSLHQRAECSAQIDWPDHQCRDAFPERQLQEPDRKKPADEPKQTTETVLFDFDFLHGVCSLRRKRLSHVLIYESTCRLMWKSFDAQW